MKGNGREDMHRLFRQLCADFGHASGLAIIRTIVSQLGGARVRVPSPEDLFREERTLRIQAAYLKGVSVPALAELWGLSERHIHRELKRQPLIPLPPDK